MSTVNAHYLKSMSTTSPPIIQNSAGTEYGRLCRASVYVTLVGGVPTMASAFNVSSITDVNVGEWNVNITAGIFSDAKYIPAGYAEWQTGTTADAGLVFGGDSTKTSTLCKVRAYNYSANSAFDTTSFGVIFFL